MAYGDSCYSDCRFKQNNKCTKIFGGCLKEQDNSKLIKENVKNKNEIDHQKRVDKANNNKKTYGFFDIFKKNK
ncbi:MAG: hypothetical protein WC346_20210 [Methanogenium sp.]